MTTTLHNPDASAESVSQERDRSPAHRRTRGKAAGLPGASLVARTAPVPRVDAAAGDDADPDGLLLSVTEIQQALRELRARGRAVAPAVPTRPSRRLRNRQEPRDGAQRRGDEESTATVGGPDDAGLGLHADWVTVVAAHAGAGASTVALAIADAAVAADRRVHLVETAAPARSGLVAAACAELGTDPTGRWRRGTRLGVVIDRRADVAFGGWPTPPAGEGPALTVIDLGLPAAADLGRLVTAGARTVVVCRATVPGVRATEQMLCQPSGLPVVVAAVGPRRWPGEVTASLGPRLRDLRSSGRVVTVPTDRRLEITGPGAAPLPKPVRAAGAALGQLLNDGGPGAAADRASLVSARRGSVR